MQLVAAHYDLTNEESKQKSSGFDGEQYRFEFDPMTSHLKHCYFNHAITHENSGKKENGTKILLSILAKRTGALQAY